MARTQTPSSTRLSPNQGKAAQIGPRTRYLLLLLLGAGAFTATYALVRWADQPPAGMVWIPGGEFTMGSDDELAWPDEKPGHRVRVAGFWMDETEVTNAQFRAFVEATGYVTTAEKKPDWEQMRKQLPPGTAKPP